MRPPYEGQPPYTGPTPSTQIAQSPAATVQTPEGTVSVNVSQIAAALTGGRAGGGGGGGIPSDWGASPTIPQDPFAAQKLAAQKAVVDLRRRAAMGDQMAITQLHLLGLMLSSQDVATV